MAKIVVRILSLPPLLLGSHNLEVAAHTAGLVDGLGRPLFGHFGPAAALAARARVGRTARLCRRVDQALVGQLAPPQKLLGKVSRVDGARHRVHRLRHDLYFAAQREQCRQYVFGCDVCVS